MEKYCFKVPGMMCMHCVGSITDALRELEGLSDLNVELADKSVSFSADASVKDKALAAIDDLGFDVE